MAAATLLQMRTRAKRRANMEDSSFVTDDEWDDYLNEELSALHDLLVSVYKEHYQTSTDISVVAGTESYSLPSDFYKSLGVYWAEGSGSSRVRYPLEPFMMDELTDYDLATELPIVYGQALRYRLIYDKIYFSPRPSSSGTVELWYVPQLTKLTADGHSTDFPIMIGWEEYVICGAAAKGALKEDRFQQAGALSASQARLEARVRLAASSRDAGKSQRVSDVYGTTRWSPRRRRYY